MRIESNEIFDRLLAKLTKEETKRTIAKLQLPEQNPGHPSLKVKKMRGDAGQKGIYRMRVTKSLRVTFTIEGDAIFLRKVGTHGETIINP